MSLAAGLAMGGCQDVSGCIPDLAFEWRADVHWLTGRRATPLCACELQLLLNAFPEVALDYGGMRAGIGLFSATNPASIDRIGQNAMGLASAHWRPTLNVPGREHAALGAQSPAICGLGH